MKWQDGLAAEVSDGGEEDLGSVSISASESWQAMGLLTLRQILVQETLHNLWGLTGLWKHLSKSSRKTTSRSIWLHSSFFHWWKYWGEVDALWTHSSGEVSESIDSFGLQAWLAQQLCYLPRRQRRGRSKRHEKQLDAPVSRSRGMVVRFVTHGTQPMYGPISCS